MKEIIRNIVNDNVDCFCYSDNAVNLEKNSDILTIVGCAENVRDDINKFGIHGDIMTINYMSVFLELPILHVVSLHADLLSSIRSIRKLNLNSQKFNNFKTHKVGLLKKSVEQFESSIDFLWKFENQPMSSGIASMLIGLAIGYKKILLLGMPFSTKMRFHDIVSGERKSNAYIDAFDKTVNVDLIKKSGSVRSVSGLTSEIYGKPTKLWLREK